MGNLRDWKNPTISKATLFWGPMRGYNYDREVETVLRGTEKCPTTVEPSSMIPISVPRGKHTDLRTNRGFVIWWTEGSVEEARGFVICDQYLSGDFGRIGRHVDYCNEPIEGSTQ